MQLHTIKGAKTRSGNLQKGGQFKIAQNAKAFIALSSTLYQNKVGSMIRELASNAYDAHVDAGNVNQPFNIHLPTMEEPWFSIRDFGNGLSFDEMNEVYTTLFESTKDNSNDGVGCFGLGCKTPFSYTDSYTVTSYQDGVATTYVNAIDGDEMRFDVMGEVEVDKPNGLEVNVTVGRNDFDLFRREMIEQLRFFPIKPEVNREVEWPDNEVEVVCKSGALRSTETHGYGNTFPVWCVQGPVGYPLDLNQIRDSLNKEQNDFVNLFAKMGGYLYFNIGDISVTLSREAIEYTATTIANIKTKIDAFRSELGDRMQDEANKFNTPYERIKWVNRSQAFGGLARYCNLTLPLATSKGMDSYFRINFEKLEKTFNMTYYSCKGKHGWAVKQLRKQRNCPVEFTPGHSSIAFYIQQPGDTRVYSKLKFNVAGKDVIVLKPIKELSDTDAIKKVRGALGGAPVALVSSLANPPRTVNISSMGTNDSVPFNCYVPTGNSCNLQNVKDWGRFTESMKELEQGYYFVVHRNEAENINNVDQSVFESEVEFDQDAFNDDEICYTLDGKPIYAVPRRKEAQAKNLGWIPLTEKLNELREILLKKYRHQAIRKSQLQHLNHCFQYYSMFPSELDNEVRRLIEELVVNSDNELGRMLGFQKRMIDKIAQFDVPPHVMWYVSDNCKVEIETPVIKRAEQKIKDFCWASRKADMGILKYVERCHWNQPKSEFEEVVKPFVMNLL